MAKLLKIDKKALCIRNASNFSVLKPEDKFPHRTEDSDRFNSKMPETSPKLVELLKTIKRLDDDDMKRHGKLFKHIVYSDVKNSAGGSKVLATALQANGFTNAYDKLMKIDKEKLSTNQYRNFALLCSLKVFGKDISISLKKSILGIFNSREDNVHGEVIRILVLDPGYKEGIDVFDVKYVHLFEPLITPADETQVIGRGTRFCGQKGLRFEPNVGWPLHVFKYELLIDGSMQEKYEATNTNELFLKNSGLNFDKLIFVSELERVSKSGAVDYELTRNIHNNVFSEQKVFTPEPGSKIKGPLKTGKLSVSFKKKNLSVPMKKIGKNNEKYIDYFKNYSIGGLLTRKEEEQEPPRIQTKKMGHIKMQEHIKKRFFKYRWDKMVYENQCIDTDKDTSIKNKLMKFTPTQEFVSNYFHDETFTKGMLLWHSVGTGKTCTAISVATTGFEPKGYTILWVTRHTLKSDLWKNMFINVCSASFRKKILNCDDYLPEEVPKNPLSYLSENWVMPISYKQFSNMLLGKNDIYKQMVKRNGKKDPIRKTLIIIDEVHKLFSTDVPVQERPNLEAIKKGIKNSYKVSGKDSARMLLMSATPISSDPMDLIKILNLIREEDMPDSFEDFSKRYLNDDNKFSKEGKELYLDDISGCISHLNRENDVRQFAYPVFYTVNATMSKMKKSSDNINKDIQEVQDKIDEYTAVSTRGKTKEEKEKIKGHIKQLKEEKKDLTKKRTVINKRKNQDDLSQEAAIDRCLKK